MTAYRSIEWRDGEVRILDQRQLPQRVTYLSLTNHRDIAAAVRSMAIRGAPAIGAAGAFGLALTAFHSEARAASELRSELQAAASALGSARPTAANLNWAIERVLARARDSHLDSVQTLRQAVIDEAKAIADEDVRANRQLSLHAMPLIPDEARIIHHCNTGSLATVDFGTALGIIRLAHEQGKHVHVYVDETRPRLQGARLTSWELQQLGIPYTVMVDSASGHIMRTVGIDLCLVGCDHVAANGDTANKIGTYNLALVARAHGVPFYVAAPTSTINLSTPDGESIEVEERPAEEITCIGKTTITPRGARVTNPAFDITPAGLITAIITEAGIAYPPFRDSLRRLKGLSS